MPPKIPTISLSVLSKKESSKQPKLNNQAYSSKVEAKVREFFVSDEKGNFWCGYKHGNLFWSDQITLARELTEEAHFNSLVRWERGHRVLKKEYLED